MVQTHMTVGKSTQRFRLLGLLMLSLILSGMLFSLFTVKQADALTSNGNIGAIATSQVGGTCGNYYGCPYTGEWCAEFAKWVWNYADANLSGLTGNSGSFYTYGQNHGGVSSTPAVGDAIVFGYTGGGQAQHVAIVVWVDTSNHTIKTVGGNEGGGAGAVHEEGPYSWTLGYSSYMGMTISGYVHPVAGNDACPAQIQNGNSGPEVKVLQSDLNYDDNAKVAVDGSFGSLTEAAVKTFQGKKGLTKDGVAGPQTWHALGAC